MIRLFTNPFAVALCCFTFAFHQGVAQDFVQSQGSRAAALGGTVSVLQDDYAPLNNQAALAFDTTYSVAVSATRRFWLSELGGNSLAISIPVGNGAIGVATSYNGFSDYNRLLAGVGYGMKFSEKIGVGVQLNYLSQTISEYGTEAAVTFEAGVQAQLLSTLWMGAHVFNPIKTKSGFYDDQHYANELSWGLMFQPSRNVILVAEAVNRNYNKFGFKAGVEYLPVKALALRAGANENEFTFGLGLRWKQFHLDLGSSYHRYLGISPTGSVMYAVGKK
ncbi:MAG TPA: hypothetical protein VEY71_07385 [Chitinophagales bacterium]|nr:hypothetical protein [Chitinophagales bacterium]